MSDLKRLRKAIEDIAWSRPPGPASKLVEQLEQQALDALSILNEIEQRPPIGWYRIDGSLKTKVFEANPNMVMYSKYNWTPLYDMPCGGIPTGKLYVEAGWTRATLHTTALRMKPEASHEELAAEVNRVMASAPTVTFE